jgi:hypothetical protein
MRDSARWELRSPVVSRNGPLPRIPHPLHWFSNPIWLFVSDRRPHRSHGPPWSPADSILQTMSQSASCLETVCTVYFSVSTPLSKHKLLPLQKKPSCASVHPAGAPYAHTCNCVRPRIHVVAIWHAHTADPKAKAVHSFGPQPGRVSDPPVFPRDVSNLAAHRRVSRS